MRKAAHFGRGTFTYISDAAQVSSRMEELFEKLEQPVLTDVEVDWSDPNADAMPDQVPDLYSGEPLILTARLFADDATVSVRGRRSGALWDASLPVGDYALETMAWDADTVEPEQRTMRGISKLWARRQIDGLMDSVVEGADAMSVRDAVVNLALTHHLVTQYTSLVAVDTTPTAPRNADPATRGVVQAGTGAVGQLPRTATLAPLYFALAIGALLVALGMMLVPALGGVDIGARLRRVRLVRPVRPVPRVRQ
jgi:Ca-activated chloride channel family protein